MNPLRELFEQRHLIASFARRDIGAKYKQTFFGAAWALIQPIALMGVFTLVFSLFAKIPSEGIPYPIFAYSALVFWMSFASCVSQGTVAMAANSNLVRKIWFPRETLLLSVMLSALLDLCVASAFLAALFVYFDMPFHATAIWVLPFLALQLIFTLAVILVTSAVHVHFRDIGHALPLLLQLWMFASPVAYPISSVPEWLRPYYLLNPMAGLIDNYRRVLLHGEAPDLGYITIAFPVALASLALAYAIFKRAERTFADVI
jgi:lipopolysaccharide transport system permease protein